MTGYSGSFVAFYEKQRPAVGIFMRHAYTLGKFMGWPSSSKEEKHHIKCDDGNMKFLKLNKMESWFSEVTFYDQWRANS